MKQNFYFSPLCMARRRAINYVLPMLLSLNFLRTLGGQLLSQNVLNRSSPNFQDVYMSAHDHSDILFAIAQETLLW